MLKVGITGGIGSGKTTVCKIFEQLGIPIYYADDRAKLLMTEDPELVSQIKLLFGESAYSKGKLNRPFIANIVFNDPEKLSQLNALVHPAVAKDGERWHLAQKNAPYTLKEAALLYEAGSYRQLDRMICVVAPEDLRIKRVMQRDQVDQAAVEARMNKQWPQSQKARLSDFLVYNDGSEFLIQQVLRIHHKLLAQNAL